ncbi:MAG: helix-turn-helix domain-containing protein [Candidatus Poseidoniaceae archaeon]|nr:hypothetical protein [Euryarchaeota archaeon]MAU75217.1 hypothetical protein [Euryarchaeota archaeon]RAH06124.1 MAG: hypothetical protein CBC92_004265 [Euryarchaeota archaeon TMED132]|tara:strand:+ start:4578 stop:5258 length:681 start_codon:yes stop_codon:yes gene_type:complete
MVNKKSLGSLRYFQIRVSHAQAKHLPGYAITNFFNSVEMIAGTGKVGSVPSCILKVEYDGTELPILDEELTGSLLIDRILEEKEGFAYLKVRTPGPIQMIVAREQDCWVVPPTYLSKKNGLFMTIQGTPKGLKKVKDNLQLLIPEKIEMRISKMIIGDLIAAPKLPERRHLVITTAVEKGYYDTPRKCTQKDIADVLGIKQGTVAEHLQYAESVIINSWADQVSKS